MALFLLGLLCGASIGREGPTVQVGAAIMFALGRVSPRRRPGLILAGASAGVVAAFNTPLAGIVFGIEEMSRSFEARTSGVIAGAVIAAGVTSLALQGDCTCFGTTPAVLGDVEGWLAVPVPGVVRAPITAFVIVGEMTDDHALILPLMLTALIAYAASRLVCPEGVYHALARSFVAAETARPVSPARG